jgi:hypothetical protein
MADVGRPSSAPGSSPDDDPLTCPWCGSPEIERLAQFGARLMSSQYMCRACHSPFEAIRHRGPSGVPDSGRQPEDPRR